MMRVLIVCPVCDEPLDHQTIYVDAQPGIFSCLACNVVWRTRADTYRKEITFRDELGIISEATEHMIQI
jgi:hypothetical protein